MKISVITPSFNQKKYLERTILSVLNQNYRELEYIIIDGGSNDGSIEIIKKYKDRLAYWVSEKDEGQAAALNKGIKVTTGQIIGWLNSDDLYRPGALKIVNDYFSDHPEVELVYGDYALIDEKDDLIKFKKEIEFDYNVLLYGMSYIPQPAAFFRKSVVDKVGIFDKDLRCVMDYDFWLRAAEKCVIRHIPFHLADFRLHGKSKTCSVKPVFRKEEFYIRRKYARKSQVKPILLKLYFRLLNVVYRVKRIFLKFVQGCYSLKGGEQT